MQSLVDRLPGWFGMECWNVRDAPQGTSTCSLDYPRKLLCFNRFGCTDIDRPLIDNIGGRGE